MKENCKMSELRKDPVVDRWVIISPKRGERRGAFGRIRQMDEEEQSGQCPFCPGNEGQTPPEILAYRKKGTGPDKPGWWIRVFPNKYPALGKTQKLIKKSRGIYKVISGIGSYEVIVETPRHGVSIFDLSIDHVSDLIRVYRDRIIDLTKDPRFQYVLVLKNKGFLSGSSINHAHSQIIATSVVPKRVEEELSGAKKYYKHTNKCIFCQMVEQELFSGERVIQENEAFLSISAFAARFPYETWILPKEHRSIFESLTEKEVIQLAEILKSTMNAMNQVASYPPFNYLIHNSPCWERPLNYYHWHMEIIPRLTRIAGFEWGTGLYINPLSPEEAAHRMRQALS